MKGAAGLVRVSDWARQGERLGSIMSRGSSSFVEGRARQ